MRNWLLAILLVSFCLSASAKTAYAYLQTAEATPIHMYPQEAFDAPVGAIPMSITITQQPKHGVVNVIDNKPHLLYTPSMYFSGKDTIKCHVITSNVGDFDARLCVSVANDVASTGTEFWVTFLHTDSKESVPEYYLSIATPTDVRVKICNPYTGWQVIRRVDAGKSVDVKIPLNEAFPDSSELVSSKAFHVLSTEPIALYALAFSNCSSDATCVFPISALSDKYMVQTWGSGAYSAPDEFAIVAVEDNTQIDISPTQNTQHHDANELFSCTLNRGQTYHVQTRTNNNYCLSGSTINSHGKPVAVFEGTMWTKISQATISGAADHLYEQSMPNKIMGTEYILPHIGSPQMSHNNIADFVKVTALEDGTIIHYCKGNPIKGIEEIDTTLNSQESWVGEVCSNMIIANKPFACSVFMPSSCVDKLHCDDDEAIGDPAMVVIAPSTQKVYDAYFSTYSSGRAFEHQLSITGKNISENKVLLDGSPIGTGTLPDSIFVKTIPISSGVHHLQCDSGIIAYVSGYKWYESYAYCVATQYRELKDTFVVIDDTICQDQKYHFGSRFLTETGTYYDTIRNSRWNDSITQLNLFVIPSLTRDTMVYDTICLGDTLFWNGIKCSKDSIYTAILQTTMGCDSTIKLDLTIRHWEFHEDSTILLGTSINWHGRILSVGGVYRDTAKSIYGCDSINILHLYTKRADDDNPPDPYPFIPVIDSLDTTICWGDTLRWRHYVLTRDTMIRDTAKYWFGVDSVYWIVNLTTTEVCPCDTSRTDTTAYSCYGTPFIWHGKTAMDGDTIVRKNTQGCDSIVTLRLYTSAEPVTLQQKDTASCLMVPFLWRGHTIVSDTLCYDTVRTTKLGCDSIYASLRFTIWPSGSSEETKVICDKQLPYLWKGMSCTTENDYRFDTLTTHGCDSTITLHLIVKDHAENDTTAYICNKDLPFIWHGKVAVDGDTIVRKNAAGCDSVVTLKLFVSEPPATLPQKDTASCQIIPFLWRGHQIVSDTLCQDTLRTTMLGCDSIYATLRFVVKEPSCSDTTAYVCYEDLPFIWHGKVAVDGDTIVRMNAAGCDSIVTLHLTTSAPMQSITQDTTVCDTVLPITWHGFEFNSILIYRDTLRNGHGCDSLEHIYTINVIHCEPPVPPVPPIPTDTCLDSLVYKKWQDVIFCDNGHHEFVSFQWFKDNKKMQGETKQYYFHEGGLGASEYFVEVTYADGTKRRTCPQSFDETPRSADTYVKVQTVIRRGESLHIAMSDPEADVFIYTVVGQPAFSTHILGPQSSIPISLPTGVYVLLLHGPNVDTTTKIIVE